MEIAKILWSYILVCNNFYKNSATAEMAAHCCAIRFFAAECAVWVPLSHLPCITYCHKLWLKNFMMMML